MAAFLYVIDGKETVRRNIVWNKRAEHIEGFFALRNYHRYGELYQLIGKERKLLRTFGVA